MKALLKETSQWPSCGCRSLHGLHRTGMRETGGKSGRLARPAAKPLLRKPVLHLALTAVRPGEPKGRGPVGKRITVRSLLAAIDNHALTVPNRPQDTHEPGDVLACRVHMKINPAAPRRLVPPFGRATENRATAPCGHLVIKQQLQP